MPFQFRPAIREQVTLLIGLTGASGTGKTMSAMRLASGMTEKGKRFAVIDTEARRSLHYADMFSFDMAELRPPFRPSAYLEAIKAAADAGYKVIVGDSVSHEWAGEGGILDWQEEELTRMAGDDYRKREACKMASWIKPKMGHKQMVQGMLQIKANLILCFRAEEKIGMEKDQNGKMVIVPKGWQPICEKSLPYELTVSFLLTPDRPGYPQPIKLQEQHKAIFPLDKPINEESGLKIYEWAKGGSPKASAPLQEPRSTSEGAKQESHTGLKVKDIRMSIGKAGNKRFTIIDNQDSKYYTFSETFAKVAKRAKEEELSVNIEYKDTEYGKELVNIVAKIEPYIPEDEKQDDDILTPEKCCELAESYKTILETAISRTDLETWYLAMEEKINKIKGIELDAYAEIMKAYDKKFIELEEGV